MKMIEEYLFYKVSKAQEILKNNLIIKSQKAI